jgi:hypothetical protein
MSSFRSITPFLRTARFAFSRQAAANPLVSLQRQTTSPVLNLARTYAQFQRTKPHVNIGTTFSLSCEMCCWNRTLTQHLQQVPSATLITERLPSRPPSPRDKPTRDLPASSTMDLSTRLLRSASVVLPLPRHTSSTRPMLATTPTSTVPVTPIISRT